jgi:flagellar hook-associated protein 1 FlgK
MSQRLNELESEVNERLTLAVADVNRLAEQIADVNQRIAVAGVATSPNDLLDQRDRLVLELSSLVEVTTTLQDDGAMNVFIGSGQPLVLGTKVQQLGVRGSEFDPTRVSVVYRGPSGNTPLDTALSGGTIGGLLEFRSRMLDSSR